MPRAPGSPDVRPRRWWDRRATRGRRTSQSRGPHGTASGYLAGLMAPVRDVQTSRPPSWVETNVPRFGFDWWSPSVGHVITSLQAAVSAMPHTSADLPHVKPPPGFEHVPINV